MRRVVSSRALCGSAWPARVTHTSRSGARLRAGPAPTPPTRTARGPPAQHSASSQTVADTSGQLNFVLPFILKNKYYKLTVL